MLCYIHMIYSSYPIWTPTPYKILLPDGFCCCWISPACGMYNLIRTLDYLPRSMIWEIYNFAAISVLAQWKCLPCFRRATIFLVGWVITQGHILFCVILAYFERFKPQNNPSRFISEPIEKAEYHLDYHRPLSSNDVHSRTIGLAKRISTTWLPCWKRTGPTYDGSCLQKRRLHTNMTVRHTWREQCGFCIQILNPKPYICICRSNIRKG